MKKILFTLMLFASVFSAKGQDESVFMHYTNAPTLVNPAHAGFQEQFQLLFNLETNGLDLRDLHLLTQQV